MIQVLSHIAVSPSSRYHVCTLAPSRIEISHALIFALYIKPPEFIIKSVNV